MKESINFNRAATFYDATRKLREDIAAQITQTLLGEIRAAGAETVLEIGVGTGRIARPLLREGVRIVGIDISTQMMAQFLAQVEPDQVAPELLLADATALPFREHSFRAAVTVHVLHLVRSVDDVAADVSRVLAPGGVLLHQTRKPDASTQEAWDSHDRFWDRMCAKRGQEPRRRRTDRDIRRSLVASGGRVRTIELTTDDYKSSVALELENLRERRHSWSWLIPDEVIESSGSEFESWLRARARPDGTFADRVTYVIEVWTWA